MLPLLIEFPVLSCLPTDACFQETIVDHRQGNVNQPFERIITALETSSNLISQVDFRDGIHNLSEFENLNTNCFFGSQVQEDCYLTGRAMKW